MQIAARIVVTAAGLTALAVAVGFLYGVREVVALWPYPTTYGLGKIFIASIFAAIGAPVVWIGLSGDLAAARAGAVNLFVVGAGLGGHAIAKVATGASSMRLVVFAVAVLVLAAVMAALFVLTRKIPWRDARPTPWLVRGAFGLFALLLTAAGGLLLARVQVFPWALETDASIAYGFIFLGAAVYFLCGLVRPVWSNAKGQLIGFLAYDLVLIVPYIRLWPSVPDNKQLSLAVYLAVLVVSGLIACWFLLFDRLWRLGRRSKVVQREAVSDAT